MICEIFWHVIQLAFTVILPGQEPRNPVNNEARAS
jgi:hypothetical protein